MGTDRIKRLPGLLQRVALVGQDGQSLLAHLPDVSGGTRIAFDGAALIDNPVSIAPGFSLGNVHVMAGVPTIFQAMVASVLPNLTGGAPLLSQNLRLMRGEGEIAAEFGALAAEFPDLQMGSYPFTLNGAYGTNLVIRGTDPARLDAAMTRLCGLFA